MMAEEPLLETGSGISFFRNNIVRLFLGLIAFLSLLVVGVLFFFFRPSDVLTVLHYNVYFGVDLLGSWWQIFMLPGVAIVFIIMDIWFAYRLYTGKRERIAAYLLLLGALMLLSSVLVGCVALAYINY